MGEDFTIKWTSMTQPQPPIYANHESINAKGDWLNLLRACRSISTRIRGASADRRGHTTGRPGRARGATTGISTATASTTCGSRPRRRVHECCASSATNATGCAGAISGSTDATGSTCGQ